MSQIHTGKRSKVKISEIFEELFMCIVDNFYEILIVGGGGAGCCYLLEKIPQAKIQIPVIFKILSDGKVIA